MTADVTIFMPVYKAEGFVRDAIESVLAQTYAGIELVIAIEPTNDRSAEICREYMADPRVKVIENSERLGWVGNVNACLDRLATPYFAFCFHDDALEPCFVETLRAALDAHPEAIAAYGAMQKFGAMGGVTPIESIVGTPFSRAVARIRNGFVGYGLKSLQRSAPIFEGLRMPEVGNTGFAADWPYELAYTLRGNFIAVPEVVYRKRFWSESVTAGWQKLGPETRAAEIVALQAEMLKVIGSGGFTQDELLHLVQLILDRFVVKFSLAGDERDLDVIADHRESVAPAQLIAGMLAQVPSDSFDSAVQNVQRIDAAEARRKLARRYRDVGRDDTALHHVQQALRLNPDDVPALILASRLLRGRGDDGLQNAKCFATRATTLDAENPIAWMALAQIHAQAEAWADALRSAETAIRYGLPKPGHAEKLIARARSHLPT